MEWKDIDDLFQRAKNKSEHEWVEEMDSSDSGSSFSDGEEEGDEGEEADDELKSESVLHEKERALLQAMKYFKKKKEETAPPLQNPNLRPIGKPLPKAPPPSDEPLEEKAAKTESLYSKTQDDKDAAWIRAHYLRHRQGSDGKARPSDATLSCPCCFTVICYDCQRHETYRNQFRAMFVANCHISEDSLLRSTIDSVVFKPVACNHCNTEVGVIDEDEVYHFFSVLTGEPI